MATDSSADGGVQPASTTPALSGVSDILRRCIQDCLECASICDQTYAYCLGRGGRHASSEHLKLLQDCSEACLAAARFMARNSRFYEHQCAFCVEVCRACAESCERLDEDDAQMRSCADACRRCQESCRNATRTIA